jgi:cysteine desulfurase
MDAIDQTYVNGHPTQRLPGNMNISFNYVEGERFADGPEGHRAVVGVRLHVGLARTVLRAARLRRRRRTRPFLAAVRFGRFTTEEEIDYVVNRVIKEVDRLREMSPLYELAKEGVDLATVKWAAH